MLGITSSLLEVAQVLLVDVVKGFRGMNMHFAEKSKHSPGITLTGHTTYFLHVTKQRVLAPCFLSRITSPRSEPRARSLQRFVSFLVLYDHAMGVVVPLAGQHGR